MSAYTIIAELANQCAVQREIIEELERKLKLMYDLGQELAWPDCDIRFINSTMSSLLPNSTFGKFFDLSF